MNHERKKIMIVDDIVANLTVARNLLKSHYETYLATSATQLFEMLEKIQVDLILLDIEMPGMDGYEALANLKKDERLADVPVIFLTAQNDEASESRGFDLGAADYINKPFSPARLLKRLEHQLLLVEQRKAIQRHADDLAVIVSEKVGEVINLQNAMLNTVTDLVEFRDKFTGGHITRTQLYLKAMIDGLQEKKLYVDITSCWDMNYILQSAQLHDVGKIGVPDAILNKPMRLSPDEFEEMKTHVTIGIDAMNRILSNTNNHTFLRHAINIVGTHHEKWDGTGYPHGLKGEEIPLEGRLMAVADVYDALVSARPYKKAFSHDEARKIIEENAGKHFDPTLVDVFLSVEGAFEQISLTHEFVDKKTVDLLTLSNDMETGIPEVDAQHRELLARMNAVIAVADHPVSKEEAQGMLDFLEEYVIKHFGDEENLQKQSQYPKYEFHKNQHQFFVGEFRKLQMEFAANAISDTFIRKLHNAVIQWIVNHIKLSDVAFGKYCLLREGISRDIEAGRGVEEVKKSPFYLDIEGFGGVGSFDVSNVV